MSIHKKVSVAVFLACTILLNPLSAFASDGGGSCSVFEDYIENGNGTLTDPRNGLTWQKCAVGQEWDGQTCLGAAVSMDWYSAMQEAKSNHFLEMNDWRLPTRDEFQSVMISKNVCGSSAKYVSDKLANGINIKGFELINTLGEFWSITPLGDTAYISVNDSKSRGGVSQRANFNGTYKGGYIGSGKRLENHVQVRLVRGRQLSSDEIADLDREFQRADKGIAELKASVAAYNVIAEQQSALYQKQKAELQRSMEAYKVKTVSFRQSVKVGDQALQGLVIEVNEDIIKVQATEYVCEKWFTNGACANSVAVVVEKWVKRAELLPLM